MAKDFTTGRLSGLQVVEENRQYFETKRTQSYSILCMIARVNRSPREIHQPNQMMTNVDWCNWSDISGGWCPIHISTLIWLGFLPILTFIEGCTAGRSLQERAGCRVAADRRRFTWELDESREERRYIGLCVVDKKPSGEAISRPRQSYHLENWGTKKIYKLKAVCECEVYKDLSSMHPFNEKFNYQNQQFFGWNLM